MRSRLYEVDDVARRIRRGDALVLAGDEAVLRRLPKGRWIAGTIPYFMTEAGGVADRGHVFVDDLAAAGLRCEAVRRYDEGDVARVYLDLPADAVGFMIAPAWSRVHLSFAMNAPSYERFATRPLVGWISGVHLAELDTAVPKVFDGTTGEPLEQQAVVMQVSLPRGAVAELDVVNIFGQGDGPTITFPSGGFSATTATVAGERRNFAEYVHESGLDLRLPLVADYCGASVNVSFLDADRERGEVRFYAPVFRDVRYRHARPVDDYVSAFLSRLPTGLGGSVAFSCSCILNYLHSGLEGRRTGDLVGPITFGEIACQLLNQTTVYLVVEKLGRGRP